MGKYIIIDCEYDVKKSHRLVYLKNLSKKLNDELVLNINLCDTVLEVRKIPLFKKNNDKIIEKFIKDMENDNVSEIILSEKVKKDEFLKNSLSKKLKLCTGGEITEKFMYDIYNKYILINNKKEYEPELVLFCDNPKKTFEFLDKVSRKIKNAYIVAENYKNFEWVIKEIYNKYGFYVYFTENPGNAVLKGKIYINLAENYNFFINAAEKNNIIILNLSGKNIESPSFLNTFTFGLTSEFKAVVKYFKYCDQEVIKFLITAINNNFNKKVMEEFINEYNVKLKKICLKNYWQNEKIWV